MSQTWTCASLSPEGLVTYRGLGFSPRGFCISHKFPGDAGGQGPHSETTGLD